MPAVSDPSSQSKTTPLLYRQLGRMDYQLVWQAMQEYTNKRPKEGGGDELWFVEHPAVYTLGQAAKPEHVLAPGDIPVIKVDRGGEVTYHGPGQLVGYLMINLAARKLGVRDLVTAIEHTLIDLLQSFDIDAEAMPKAPGVYVKGCKIASLGLRVRRGCSFHGFSLNVSVDKSHFSRINPCGFEGLEVCNLAELVAEGEQAERYSERLANLPDELAHQLVRELGYTGLELGAPELPVLALA